MLRLHFTHWELDSGIGKVEREIMEYALESLLVDAIAIGDQGRCKEIYTGEKLAPAITIAVWFCQG